MADKKEEVKTVELWEGKVVPIVNEHLLKDYDYCCDLKDAERNQDVKTLVSMNFALLENGDQVFEDVRQHIIADKGYFDIETLMGILGKIMDAFPKGSSPAQKRW